MLLLVGLGNPGPSHAENRHNIGFMAVDRIVARHGLGSYRSRFQGLIAEGRLDGTKVLALKPMTYMNESGRCVGEAARFYKLAPEDIVVIHDEIDLKPGKLRVKRGGGHAGHNGLRSIDQHIGRDYRRVRIGVGHPGDKDLVHPYLLGNFTKADRDWLARELDAVAEAAPLLVAGDDAGFTTKVAAIVHPDRPDKPRQAKRPTPAPAEDAPAAADDRVAEGPPGTLGAALRRALARLRGGGAGH